MLVYIWECESKILSLITLIMWLNFQWFDVGVKSEEKKANIP